MSDDTILSQLLRFRSLFRDCDDAIVDCDLDGRIVGWNASAERMLGYAADEVLGLHVGFLNPPHRHSEIEGHLRVLHSGGRVGPFETERLRKDGSLLPVSVTPSRILDLEGQCIGTAAILRDLSASRAAEASLRRQASIINATRDAIIGIDLKGQIYGWSKGAQRLFGFNANEMQGQPVGRLIPPDRQAEFESLYELVRHGRTVEIQDTIWEDRSSRRRDVSVRLSPIRDEHGEVSAMACVCTDLTASKQTERQWRSVVENAPEHIIVIDREGLIRFINRTDPQLPIEQVVGQPHELFVPPGDRERVRGIIQGVFATGEAAGYDTEARSPEGALLGWYACRVGPIMVEGTVESVVIIASNITERRQMEEELRHSRAQLRRLTARQQSALEEERRHIARELHDELGQLLTALKIDLAWLEGRIEEPTLLDRTAAMTEIVSATMSTIRRISTRLRPQLLDDLGPRAALDWLAQEICERAGISCQLAFDLGGQVLDEDCALTVFRICQEALTNVVRHAEASRVSIEVKVEQARLELSIRDDGIGISDGQLDSSLGLLGLQERVHMLGGEVTIAGTSRGTLVRTLLPLGGQVL